MSQHSPRSYDGLSQHLGRPGEEGCVSELVSPRQSDGLSQNWDDLVGRVCIRTWYHPPGVLQQRRELQHFAIYKHRPWPILKFEFLMGSQIFSDVLSFFSNY